LKRNSNIGDFSAVYKREKNENVKSSKNLSNKHREIIRVCMVLVGLLLSLLVLMAGCGPSNGGYSNEWLYSQDIQSVYVEMFENESFRVGWNTN